MSRQNRHVLFASLFALGSFHFDPAGVQAPPAQSSGQAPPPPTLQQLHAEFGRLQTEATGVIETAQREGRELTADEQTANDQRFNRMKAISTTMREQERFASLQVPNMPAAPAPRVQNPTTDPGQAEFNAGEGQSYQFSDRASIVVLTNGARKFHVDQGAFSNALTDWARTGLMDRQFATITSATSSGVLMPKVVGQPIVPTHANPFRLALGLWGMTPQSTGGTANLSIPIINASAGTDIDEDEDEETENEPGMGGLNLNVRTYQSGTAWLGNLILEANDWDLTQYVQTDLQYAKEQRLEAKIAAGLIADTGATNVVRTATTTGFTVANLLKLNRALPSKYDRMKIIVLDGDSFSTAEGLTENGVPALLPDPSNPQILRFRGTPVLRCDGFEALEANKTIGVCMSVAGFRIRDASVMRLKRFEQASKPDHTGFNLIGYHGFDWDDNAVAKFKTAES